MSKSKLNEKSNFKSYEVKCYIQYRIKNKKHSLSKFNVKEKVKIDINFDLHFDLYFNLQYESQCESQFYT